MRFEFHPEALEEYQAAGHYYAAQQPNLDARFVTSVEQTIERIAGRLTTRTCVEL